MRLINVVTRRIEEFFEHLAPPYAILSHTWGDSEVSLQAYEACYDQPNSPTRSLQGYHKIDRACEKSVMRNLQYCWIDTCCIDKTSSAELSESINSMFRWYRQAAVCLVYLRDYLESPKPGATDAKPDISHCRWFTRGWTLQELVASREVHFFDSRWLYIANKLQLHPQLSAITAIDRDVLLDEEAFRRRPVACRLSWASKRVTTRAEDQAYSLLGILEVNMPLIYGEGANAFRRLQHEVLQKHDDPSLFVWNVDNISSSPFQHMLAPDVASFAGCQLVRWRDEYKHSTAATHGPSFTITTRGIRV
ncbi:HET domain-containing protein [Microdochium nivale]|nr:HET domain-containing protein [Microdochium nivale]